MANIFRIELLPARHGDCILVEYGDEQRPSRLLIDGGPIAAYPALEKRLRDVPVDQREFELLVITHIDADHIEGGLKLLNHPELATFRDIWFNGWPHLGAALGKPTALPLHGIDRSVEQGSFAGVRIGDRLWNGAFGGKAIFVPVREKLPHIDLPGGMRLTLLAPPLRALEKLRTVWLDWYERRSFDASDQAATRERLTKKPAYRQAGLPQRVVDILESASDATGKLDGAVANGSSIAFIAEYDGKRCAFLGDAHMPPIEQALQRLADQEGTARVRLDAVKLAHHGSASNLSAAFLELVECDVYLVSTDGSIFGHPDDAAIKMLVTGSPGARLLFNYRSEQTAVWDNETLRQVLGYRAGFPGTADGGIVFDVMTGEARENRPA